MRNPGKFPTFSSHFDIYSFKGIQKYIPRIKEYGRSERRHSSFHVGLYCQLSIINYQFREQNYDKNSK